jgi:hypothetical protein
MRQNKRLTAIAILALATLGTPVAAGAHTMDRRTATAEAYLAAYDWAEHHEGVDESTTDVTVTRRDCSRINKHRWRCWPVKVEFTNTSLYGDEAGDVRECWGQVTVWYASARSRQVRTRVSGMDCA